MVVYPGRVLAEQPVSSTFGATIKAFPLKIIEIQDSHRRKHFDFFRQMDQPHFGITAEVDITEFLDIVRRSARLRFTPAIVYLISRTAHELRPFRWRIRGEQVVEHEMVRPSFTVPTSVSDVFSFCTVDYREDPEEFHDDAVAVMEEMKHNPSLEDEEHADNYLFLSAFPWASFTNVFHAMHYSPTPDSVPLIVWVKYRKVNDRVMMPLAVQAHHAVVDGSDLGRYYQTIQRHLRQAHEIFKNFE
jgi:chloramphenicol O-acetyltransferase type A